MAQTSPETDREALVALYNATDGLNWTRNNSWLSDVPTSEWEGVTTDDNGRVTELDLRRNQLTAEECLQESRGGRNVQHRLVGLLRQSVYSRLAGYEDTNDAERLADDPAMRVVVGQRGGPERPAASTNTMSRFETEVLTQDGNVEGAAVAG